MSKLVEITDAKSFDSLIKNELRVIVGFWAPWCSACHSAAAVIKEVSGGYDGKVVFAKNNIDLNLVSANQYNVMSIPTLIAFKSGVEVGRMTASHIKSRVQSFIVMLIAKE